MKTSFLLLLTVFFSSLAFSQGTQTPSTMQFYTQNGERFTLFVNGVQQNLQPTDRYTLTQLGANNYRMKFVFENEVDGSPLEKDFTMASFTDYVYEMRQEKNTDLKKSVSGLRNEVKWMLGDKVTESDAEAASRNVIWEFSLISEIRRPDAGQFTSGELRTSETGAPVNKGSSPSSESTTGEVSPGSGTAPHLETTTVTPHSSPTGGEVAPNTPCTPLSEVEFEDARQSVASKASADTKMRLARQITRSNCLTTYQIKTFMELFDFDENRLDYAKYAYPYCSDPNRYYRVNDAFEFESSIEELDSYLQSR